jgi:hypothetical protein
MTEEEIKQREANALIFGFLTGMTLAFMISAFLMNLALTL